MTVTADGNHPERLRIELLGQFQVSYAQQRLTRFDRQQSGELLAFLAYNPGRVYTREGLIDKLWTGEDDRSMSRNLFRVVLSTLRKNLKQALGPSVDAIHVVNELIVTSRDDIWINPEVFVTDVIEFEALVNQALLAETVDESATALLKAAELYQGEMLTSYNKGVYYDGWLCLERQYLLDRYLRVLHQLTDYFESKQDCDQALKYARLACKADWHSTQAHEDIIRLYHVSGQSNVAIQHYRRLETDLQSYLSPATQLLIESILTRTRSGTQSGQQPGQTTHLGGADLPVRLSPIIGRRAECGYVQEVLLQPATRLVTLTGAGGNGKTRLATEIAHQLCDHFAGRVWFVPLAHQVNAALILVEIQDALGLSISAEDAPLEQVVVALSQQPGLLVLDNFEHLMAEGTATVLTLLSRTPGLTCLITSRHRLALPGEKVIDVQPLPIPEENMALAQLGSVASVQLFMERAREAAPEFQLKSQNAAAIAALCQRLEGIPLAIELVAARVSGVSLNQMLHELSNSELLLNTRDDGRDGRHQSLWAAISWSYQLLRPEVQRFFARLSVFQGSWTVPAAADICEEPEALDASTQLRSHSLISLKADIPELHFGMLKVVQEFAAAQLSMNEAYHLQQHHAAYYLNLVKATHPDLLGEDQGAWLNQLGHEMDNLRATLAWSVSGQNDLSLGLELVGLLCKFWEVRGYLQEGSRWLEEALDVSSSTSTPNRAKALSGLGSIYRGQGKYKEATDRYLESLNIYRELRDETGEAGCLNGLGNIAYLQGGYVAASHYYDRALVRFRRLENSWWIAAMLNNLGNIWLDHGELQQAQQAFEEARQRMLGLGERRDLSYVLINLGDILREKQDYQGAKQYLQEALAINAQLADVWGRAYTLHNLGHLAEDQGDLQRAFECYTESLNLCAEVGDQWGGTYSTSRLGKVAQAQGDHVEAVGLYQQALRTRQAIKDKKGIAEGLEWIAAVMAEQGQIEQAVKLLGAAAQLREQINSQRLPTAEADYQRQTEAARVALGTQRFDAAMRTGREMRLEQAIARALSYRF